MTQNQHLEAFGSDELGDADSDFASEHQDTTVAKDITAGTDDKETESPEGWSGQDDKDTL